MKYLIWQTYLRFSYTTGSYSGDSGGQTKESKNKETPEDGVNTNFAAVIGVFVTLSAVEGIIILICYIKKEKGKGNNSLHMFI